MACFADINVSQGSVATYARCGGSFSIHLTANLPRKLPVIFLIGPYLTELWSWVSGLTFLAQPVCITSRHLPKCIPLTVHSSAGRAYERTNTRLTALFRGLPGWASTRKVKPIWTVVKVDRRIRCHYTTTILRLRIGARLTRYRNCKFHNFARTISRHADGISRYSVPPI